MSYSNTGSGSESHGSRGFGVGPWPAGNSRLTEPTFLYSELGRTGFLAPGSGSVSSSRFLVFLLLFQGKELNHLQLFDTRGVPSVSRQRV